MQVICDFVPAVPPPASCSSSIPTNRPWDGARTRAGKYEYSAKPLSGVAVRRLDERAQQTLFAEIRST